MISQEETRPDELDRAARAKKATWIGFVINMILSLFKIAAGIIGHSGAMIADGVHSISDFVTDIIVIVFIGVSAKGENTKYRYGHGKFETFATMIISIVLIIVAVGLFWSSAKSIVAACRGEVLPRPGMIAFVMAVISVVVKEWLFRYTRVVGEQIHSMALVANAWHHRSDAFSSIAVVIGIGCALFLGENWRILDPIAALVVSIFIAIVGFRLAIPSIDELLEKSLPEETNREIGNVIAGVDGVITYHHLRTRKNGNVYIMDFHIKVNPDMTVVQAHKIATDVEDTLRRHYGANAIVNIHIEPYNGETVCADKSCRD